MIKAAQPAEKGCCGVSLASMPLDFVHMPQPLKKAGKTHRLHLRILQQADGSMIENQAHEALAESAATSQGQAAESALKARDATALHQRPGASRRARGLISLSQCIPAIFHEVS